MSRKPSKFRKRKREQREHRTIVSVDIETRSITEKRNNVVTVVRDGHHHINVRGDSHFGADDQLMAYAATAGFDKVVVVTGGDIIHGDKK